MNTLSLGPEGVFLPEAVLISGIIAVLTWRHFGFRAAALVTMGVAILFAVWNATMATPTLPRQLLVASFVIVPSVILLGASRLRWMASRPWALLVAGPIAFVGSYMGLCLCAFSVAPEIFL
jgi:hypothetical protein